MNTGSEHGRGLRALRKSLVAGAVYDLALGAVIMTVGPALHRALDAPLTDPFHFRAAAVVLFVLPGLYLAAARARDPDPFRAAVLWARGGGGLLLLALTTAHRPPAAGIYAALGLLDLAWAGLHAFLWRRPAR